jgi:transcriptional regulator with XRE-family HTH domain
MAKTNEKTYSGVTEMVRDLVDDQDFAADFEKHLASRQISKKLFVLRNTLGMSQKDIADEIGCTQSRISKLESGADEDLRVGDLFAYLDAMGMGATIVVHNKSRTAVDQVKSHALSIKRLCDQLATLAVEDSAIAKGVSVFFGETASNLISMLHESAKRLPLAQESTIQADLDEGGHGSNGKLAAVPKDPPSSPRKKHRAS